MSTDHDNPLSVDEAMALIGKWETHPGLLLAIFDAARKLRDEVEVRRDNNVTLMTKIGELGKENKALQTELDRLRDTKNNLVRNFDELLKINAEHCKARKAKDAELDRLRDTKNNLVRNFDELLKINAEHCKARKAKDAELDQLRAVVAQNNQSLCGIITRWIKPSTN